MNMPKTELTIAVDLNSTTQTIEHLFYATSSFVYHFVAISDLKLGLQSRNAQ